MSIVLPREKLINYIYAKHNTIDTPEGIYQILMFIEKNLTDKMVTLIQELSMELELVDLYLFTLTSSIIHDYNENIGRLDYKDYENQINTLSNIADDLQYYSQTQISIDIPKFPLEPAHLIYLFLNRIVSDYPKSVYTSFLAFYGKKRKGLLNEKIHNVIKQYARKETYRPNIQVSHKHLLTHVQFSTLKLSSEDKEKYVNQFMRLVEKKQELLENRFCTFQFSIQKRSFLEIMPIDVIDFTNSFSMQAIHYDELNKSKKLLEMLKECVHYDIYEHLDQHDLIKELDPFSIWHFSQAVSNHKFMIYGTVNSSSGDKFRNQIETLKYNLNKLSLFSKNRIYIQLPLYRNENIYQLKLHLLERGIEADIIKCILEFFLLRDKDEVKDAYKSNYKKVPRTDKYLDKKERKLTDTMHYLQDLYKNDRYYIDSLSKDETFLNDLEEMGLSYCDKQILSERKEQKNKLLSAHYYEKKIDTLLNIYEQGINTKPSTLHIDIVKSFVPRGKMIVFP